MPPGASDNTAYANNSYGPFGATEPVTRVKQSIPFPGSDTDHLGGIMNPDQHQSKPAERERDRERRMSIGSAFSARVSMMASESALLGPKRPRPHKIWKKKYIKIMVVGDSGLGKTTLIKSLMSTGGERLQVHDGSYTPSEQFLKDPDSLCSTITWRDEEDRVIWVYKIQDTPGYGDDLNVDRSISNLTRFIEEQNIKWLELEQSRDRKDDLAEVEDPRVDICLFAIPPHRLRAMDIKVMYELGKFVPLVPVVTKADTMSVREAATYRNDVATKLSNPMMPGIRDKINVFKFERDTLERAGMTDSATPVPPFLVVASNDINEELNAADPPVYWPERRYPWGTAEAFNREHSDLLGLRALLLKEALEEINKTKRTRYEAWRRKQLHSVQASRRIRSILMWTIIPAMVCLQIGRKGININQVRRTVTKTVDRVRDKLGRATPGAAVAPAPVAVVEAPPPPPPPVVAAPPPPPPKKKGWGAF